MKPIRSFITAAIALGATVASASPTLANPCAGGGSLTITAASDSLTTAATPATTFNFGEHVIVTAAASGFSITSYAWTIDGPTIKDYNEDLGTQNTVMAPAALGWSTTPLAAADLSAASVKFFWVPAAAQFEPNNGPFTRNVSLTVAKSGGGSCTVSTAFTVERNETNMARKAEDFYTSNHRATTTTNPNFGHVVDEHIFWHMSIDGDLSVPQWMHFLAWHGEFVRRFDQWRQEFGYDKVAPWYPGRALPTGPQYAVDPSLRIAYFPDNNRIPTYYTIAGGTGSDGGGQHKLADYATFEALTSSFEGNFHGQVHCDIGAGTGSFFGTAAGPGYGSMCNASSPRDPMFWRWHGFIDVMYRNYCHFHSCSSPSPVDPSADPWIADNASDTGAVPSPGTHWISPDVWNRRTLVTGDACVAPIDSYGDHLTTGGVVRNCGSDADHENPEAGVTNYLYGTLRNSLPGSPRVVYAEVAVYYALASTGLTFPTNFTMVPESRQFIALHTEPGTTTSIGPIPWVVPPLPPANDHYCLYLRVLSVQETPPTVSGMGIDHDVAYSNSLAWRNIKVVPPGDPSPPAFFIVRNIGKEPEPLALRFDVPAAFLREGGVVHIALDETLMRAFKAGGGKTEGMKTDERGGFVVTGTRAEISALQMAAGEEGHVKVELGHTKLPVVGDVTVTQSSRRGVDGGVTLRLSNQKKAELIRKP